MWGLGAEGGDQRGAQRGCPAHEGRFFLRFFQPIDLYAKQTGPGCEGGRNHSLICHEIIAI